VNAVVPLLLLGWDAAHGDLGANPVELVLRSTGTMALVFLVLTLAVTPARKIFGLPWLTRLRRTLRCLRPTRAGVLNGRRDALLRRLRRRTSTTIAPGRLIG